MSQCTTSPEPNTTDTGREADGRCADGIPFARQVAALRTAMVNAVTPQDIQAITARLVQEARDGDKAATKILFQHAIGKPQPAVNPDRLDIEEMRTYLEASFPPEVILQMQQGVPLRLLLTLWPLMLAANERRMAEFVQDRLAKMDEKDRRRAERARNKAEHRREEPAAPSTDGSDGATDASGAPNPPSTDGDYGQEMIAAMFDWLCGQRGESDDDPRT